MERGARLVALLDALQDLAVRHFKHRRFLLENKGLVFKVHRLVHHSQL